MNDPYESYFNALIDLVVVGINADTVKKAINILGDLYAEIVGSDDRSVIVNPSGQYWDDESSTWTDNQIEATHYKRFVGFMPIDGKMRPK